MSQLVPPPYDPEIEAAIALMPDEMRASLTAETIPAWREFMDGAFSADVSNRPIKVSDHTVTSFDGAEIVVSVARRTDHKPGGPAVYYIHGGGMVMGEPWMFADGLLGWVETYDAVLATVAYRLAPEFPDPVPVEDCHAGFVWFAGAAEELGFDPSRIMISGASAGGGLSAGTALLARDRGGPAPAAQLLMCPMLDDRNDTVSARQFVSGGLWDRVSNETGWTALLGDRCGGDAVSIYAAPARAEDLSNLPPAFIDVGSAEVFRDESVAYASRIWASGGIAELHVWPGGWHGFDLAVPGAAVSIQAARTREAWVARHLGT